MKEKMISAGLQFFRATGLDRLPGVLTRGSGAILMFHNVRPFAGGAYAPNRPLEITPEFLEATIALLRKQDYDIVPIGSLPERLAKPGARRFAVLTFDDGYRDNLENAAPILRRHEAPYAVYVTTGFAERSARLWWLELEACIGAVDLIEMTVDGKTFAAPCTTESEKTAAYLGAFAFLRRLDEATMLGEIAALQEHSGARRDFADLCMTWDEIRAMAEDPLCTIGVHTLTHPRLTKYGEDIVRRELSESRQIVETQIGRRAVHLAYPFGDAGSAGPREFAIARECGFETAVTTRPGVLFPEHAAHLAALPRVAVQGTLPNARALESLLTGAPFAIWNRGRRVNVS